MTQREIERLEKDSIHTLRMNCNLKDLAIQGYLNDLNKLIKLNLRKKNLVIFVAENKTFNSK